MSAPTRQLPLVRRLAIRAGVAWAFTMSIPAGTFLGVVFVIGQGVASAALVVLLVGAGGYALASRGARAVTQDWVNLRAAHERTAQRRHPAGRAIAEPNSLARLDDELEAHLRRSAP